mmetsp:Transcript_1660/g.3676  ORF Transcript_1660/g.3676 Transcript_1660/m.3676 type:complete len:421 (-) Transcript_1660:445-1707(-)
MKEPTTMNGGSTPNAPTKGRYLSNRILVLFLFVMLAWNLYQEQQQLSTGSQFTIRRRDEIIFEDEANTIIRKSYEETYAHILPCEDDIRPSSGKACMQKTIDYFNTPTITKDLHNTANNSSTYTISTIPTIPWWFQTLLRDIPTNGAYGFWHHFYTTQPPLNFCTIEKCGTTEWRKAFCKLNADDCLPNPFQLCGKKKCAWRTKKKMPDDAPFAVFLRDPLERLLSGFLDKCHKPFVRRKQGHCEPNVVFNPDDVVVADRGKGGKNNGKATDLMAHLEDKDKQFFAAYLDVMPLKWNAHFIPQAIVCDLHRNIDKYDFVGNMGENFMSDLERMANQFGDQLPRVLNETFGYKTKANLEKKNTGKEKNRHATHAPEKVKKFYTARTVRKGLEMLSIDYVLLGLEVPEWARQMLKDDVSGEN